MTPEQQRNLERLVSQAVRDLPVRRAPRSLESRVQAEIARRGALPWWRRSFLHWPVAAKIAFFVVCVAIAKVVLTATVWVSAGINSSPLKAAFASEIQWLGAVGRLCVTSVDVVSTLISSIPPLWLYGGAAIVAGLYAALFGLGAAAYRTLSTSA